MALHKNPGLTLVLQMTHAVFLTLVILLDYYHCSLRKRRCEKIPVA